MPCSRSTEVGPATSAQFGLSRPITMRTAATSTNSSCRKIALALIDLFLVQFALSGGSPAGLLARTPVHDN